jgi:predicted transcriptional regulator
MENNSILLSIKPPFANLIVDGIKTVELRRKFPEVSNTKCFIYSSSPTQAIIGECFIETVEKLSIEELWMRYSEQSMIGWAEYSKYFSEKEYGYALILKKYLRYEQPIKIDVKVPSGRPPQSFCYIN